MPTDLPGIEFLSEYVEPGSDDEESEEEARRVELSTVVLVSICGAVQLAHAARCEPMTGILQKTTVRAIREQPLPTGN